LQPGRNDPCPCGSGKRYKHCCGQVGIAPEPAVRDSTGASARADQTIAAGVTRPQLLELVPLLQAGRYEELERRARELTALDPASGGAWKALGVSLALQQRDALPALQRAAELLPEDAEVHANLGTGLLGAGRYAEAIASLRRALEIRPEDADAHSNLGNALRADGQIEAALASYRTAVRIRPGHAGSHSNLGNMLQSIGRPEQAVDSYRSALELQPEEAASHNNLAIALLAIGRPDEALTSARRAIELAPESPEAHSTLGNALLDLGQFEQAEDAYRGALALNPGFADALGNLAIALRLQGRAEEAIGVAHRALELTPHSAATLVVLADAHADCGDFGQAEQRLRDAIAIEPDSPQAWAGLAHLRAMRDSDAPWLSQALRIAAKDNLAPRMEIQLRYAIGKYFDDLKQYKPAFAQYRQANELSKRHRVPYDRVHSQQETDRLIHGCNSRWLEGARAHGVSSSRPVFIVGMPRSGTSLVEQILASHPDVWGAGELTFWNSASTHVEWKSDSAGEAIDLGAIARDYLRLLDSLSADARRVVDKMPENFRHLGLIHAALPEARIIHVRRHPLDTCLSIYFQDFKTPLAYATDLSDLAHYYRQYWLLMEHWRWLLPRDRMFEVSYEAMVANPERWTRALLEFVGLPWDARCLEFHQTRRSVVTASKWQVRQKISAASVARWRHYEQYLSELLPLITLADAGAAEVGAP
jgi:Tfp pilus assembly protein PilF